MTFKWVKFNLTLLTTWSKSVGVALALLAYSKWRACDALAFWRLLLLLYCLGIFQAAGGRVASGSFMRFRRAPLHVLVILPSSAFLVSLVNRVFVGLFSPSLPSQ